MGKLFGLITGNPYVALAGFLAVAGAAGGAWFYLHHLHQEIADANAARDVAITAQGKLEAQKTELIGTVADEQTQVALLKATLADAQAAANQAHADKAASEDAFNKVISNARKAPSSADGPVSTVLGDALRGLCLARSGATAAGCGG